MKILGEESREKGITTGCFVNDLGANECRAGCNVCNLTSKLEELYLDFSQTSGPGMNTTYC